LRAPLEAPIAAPVAEDRVSPLAARALNTIEPRPADAARGIVTANEEQRIAAVLRHYTDAYAQLNTAAAKAVWPSVDVRALSRAFDALESQEIVFDGCTVNLAGSEAQAVCQGNLTYVPKRGRKSPRTVGQRWSFVMKKTSDEWTITRAEMR
jgi:ketosteroid isomerase-like protein